MSNKQKILLLLILVAALCLRVIFSVAVVGLATGPRGDEVDYTTIAGNIASGDGYRPANEHLTARRPPLYPLFLAFWFKIAGAHIELARILQWLLGTLIAYLVFRLGRIVFDPPTALIAAAAVACNPFLIFISAYALTENLYIVLVLLLLGRFALYARDAAFNARRAVVAGVLLGLAVLCRPNAFFLWIFIVAEVILYMRQRLASRLRTGALFLAVLFLVLLPWAWRNHAVFGEWVWFTTHGGITFYQGNNQVVMDTPQYHGSVAPLYMLPEYQRLKTLDEITRDNEAWRLGKKFLGEEPRQVPLLVSRKLQRFWRFKSDVGMSGIKSGWWWNTNSLAGKVASHFDAGLIYALPVIPLFLVGLVVTRRRHRYIFLWYGVIVVHTLLAMMFFGSLRARLPLEPVMALFAAAGLIWITRRLRPAAPDSTMTSTQLGG